MLLLRLAFLALLPQAAPAAEHAIYKSGNRGATWARSSAGLPASARVNSFGATANRIFAGTDAGIYSSADEGRTWQKTSVTARTISFAASGATIFAGTHNAGLLASDDQGLTWRSIASLASRNIRSLLAGEGELLAGTDADGVMVSSDQGRTWAARNAGLPPFSQIFALARIDETIFAALYAKGLYAWKSGVGPNWTRIGNVQPLALAAADAASRALAVGHNPGGIFWSRKPESPEWTKAIGNFTPPAPVWEMAAGNGIVLAGVADGVFSSGDGGRTWSQLLQGLPAASPAVSFLIRGDTIFAGLIIPRK